MAFPTIPTVGAGRVVTGVQANTTATRTFPDLSSLTKNSGDLLVAIVVGYQSSLTSNIYGTWGAGFTEVRDIGVASQMCVGVAYKISDGTETGTFTVTQAGTVTGHAAMFLLSIPGAHPSTAPEVSAALATGTSAAANPAALNPAAWDVEDTLWIALGASGETATTGSYTGMGLGAGPPTNYTDAVGTGESADVVGAVGAAVAFRQNAVASEDVGTWSSADLSNARNVALVIAIRPGAAATVLAPDPIALDLGSVAPAMGLTLSLAPSTVAVSLGAPASSAAFPPLVLAPNSVVLDLGSVSPAFALTLGLAPSAVALDLGSVTPLVPTGAVTLSPSPGILDLGSTTPTIGLVLALAPPSVLVDLGLPQPTVIAGSGAVTLAPVPVVLDLGLGAASLSLELGLSPAPAVLDLGDLGGSVTPGSLVLLPSPATLDLSVPLHIVTGPVVIVSGSDHSLIEEAIAFYLAYDMADELTRRQLLRDWLLTHGGKLRWEDGFQTIKGGLLPSRY